tara:strand:- start:833 stop:2329 length:1497 start_codon:yes stop_codon:yes gene_type:complete
MVFILLALGVFIALFVFSLRKLKIIHNKKVDQNIAEILEAKSQLTAERKKKKEEGLILQKTKEEMIKKESELFAERNIFESKKENFKIQKNESLAKIQKLENSLISREEKILSDENQIVEKLEHLSKITKKEAKDFVINAAKKANREALKAIFKEGEEQAFLQSQQRAQQLLLDAVQGINVPTVLGNDILGRIEIADENLKGRIIGRAGRNIKYFQERAGVDLIVDETLFLTISSFDGVRQAIATIALERLIKDGRIHAPAIDREIKKATEEVSKMVNDYGEKAAEEAGVPGLDKTVIKMIGRMSFRSSFGQNLLQHSVECARIAGQLAKELSLDQSILRRMALLHDIGKILPSEGETESHALAGAKLLKEHGESKKVVNAVASHHGEEECESVEGEILKIADALSGARPGARRDTYQIYIERLKRIEELGNSLPGVVQTYAVSAGREIRVILDPDRTTDEDPIVLAGELLKKIKKELDIPGKTTITVIREKRDSIQG